METPMHLGATCPLPSQAGGSTAQHRGEQGGGQARPAHQVHAASASPLSLGESPSRAVGGDPGKVGALSPGLLPPPGSLQTLRSP